MSRGSAEGGRAHGAGGGARGAAARAAPTAAAPTAVLIAVAISAAVSVAISIAAPSRAAAQNTSQSTSQGTSQTAAQDGGQNAQASDAAWFADVRYERDLFSGGGPVWTDWSAARAAVFREIEGGTVGLEVARERRFGRTDASLTVDAYRELWDGAYANLRARTVPGADVLPRSDWRGEVFQSFGSWEASLHAWHMNSAGPDPTLAGAGLARYLGAWYLRARSSGIWLGEEETGSLTVQARRFLGGSREYVEASAGAGGEVIVLGPGPELEVRDTWFVQATGQRYLWSLGGAAAGTGSGAGDAGGGAESPRARVGVQATAGLHDFEGIPRRTRLSLGVVAAF